MTVVPLEWLIVGRFEPETIIANIIGAGWAKPFGISGHLWFITMMMMMYIGFIVFSYLRLNKVNWRWWVISLVLMFVGYVALQDKLTTFSKAGPLLFMYCGAIMFAKGNELVAIAKRHKMLIGSAAVVLLFLSIYVYVLGWSNTHKAMAVFSFIIAGMASFLASYSCLNITTENRVTKWLSSISYEIYLVHMPIVPIAGLIFSNPLMHLASGIILTIIFAIILNKISNKIISYVNE